MKNCRIFNTFGSANPSVCGFAAATSPTGEARADADFKLTNKSEYAEKRVLSGGMPVHWDSPPPKRQIKEEQL